jgi:hypothetical protein
MEQTVWIYFGVITVILAFGIVGKLILDYKNEAKDDLFDRSVEELKGQCEFVCSSAPGTRIAQQVDLPSGMVLFTEGKRICGVYKKDTRCVMCSCELSSYTLNLNTSLALKTFQNHEYNCFFSREDLNVVMECQG